MSSRSLAMSRTGRWLLVTDDGVRELIDLADTMPTRVVDVSADAIVEFVGRELWVVDAGSLTRLAPTDLRALSPAIRLPPPAIGRVTGIIATGGPSLPEAVLVAPPPWRVTERGDALMFEVVSELRDDERLLTGLGARLYLASSDGVRTLERNREIWKLGKLEGQVIEAVNLFAGRAIAVLLRCETHDAITVVQAHGARIHSLTVPTCKSWAVAEDLGHAFLLGVDGGITRVDLRYGRVVASGKPIVDCSALAVDQAGRHTVLLSPDTTEVIHIQASQLLRPPPPSVDDIVLASDERRAESTGETGDGEPAGGESNGASSQPGNGHSATPIPRLLPGPPPPDARAAAAPLSHRSPPQSVEIPNLLPLALGPPAQRSTATAEGSSPYSSARAHLDSLLDIVATRAALVIADGWHTGRLSQTNATRRPHELEVEALIGATGGFAPEKLGQIKDRLTAHEKEAATRTHAAAAAGVRLPFPTLARELGLAPLAAQVLLVTAAPALRGEIARLYGVLTNDPARPMVDRFLIEQIVAGDRGVLRDQIARELAPDAPLVRHGLIQLEPALTSLFARLTVPDALLDRLRGVAPNRADDVTQIRGADVALDDLLIVPEVKRKLVLALAEPTPPHAPLRLVLRGRRGSGRHSLLAAVAARLDREIIAIDTTRLPHGRRELVTALRTMLFRASLHGLIPVLSGLEQVDPTDTGTHDAVRQVLRTHPGPLCLRTSPESVLPIDPGFVSIALPPLPETERAAAWTQLLLGAGLAADADRLASRYRIGPGIIKRVIAALTVAGAGQGDATSALDEHVRQHVAQRLDHVARRVDRLAHWEDVALPDELIDSLREFIGRARHRRTVYERWGYDAKMTTSRGLTALFYGPPGTGKTMVAGVIAQELGLDMFRVDLARVVSKWVGETEKNLAEVFDAAEDGQVLILFDEADSLFAKRTDVRTSNDRYANLEVNYLLQRLDTFDGIAILTSNLDGSIDPAFKRRLSLRLQFPFPDEDTRVQLWTAHVTPETPVAGDFDFVDLAKRFPLSGGYIRNCVMRAAFLAAHEGQLMSQQHLVRAIQLEYREIGKLSTTSRLE